MSILTLFVVSILGSQALANDKEFRLAAPDAIVDSGLLKYMLPRFSLKTQVRIKVVARNAKAEAAIGDIGTPVFSGLGKSWSLHASSPEHVGVQRFMTWLASDVGHRTISAFETNNVSPFSPAQPDSSGVEHVAISGNAVLGRALSQKHCARCHVVVASERMNAIGSTPSFFALRSLSNWDQRFAAFYALNPHPSFTQVKDVTPAFAESRPPSIVPLTMTIADVEAILAYVASIEPADLGAPLLHQ